MARLNKVLMMSAHCGLGHTAAKPVVETLEKFPETYERRLEDIFQVQDEIAAAIVAKLRIELAPQEQQMAVRDKAPTQNVEAYELYLQGRAVWKRQAAARGPACHRHAARACNPSRSSARRPAAPRHRGAARPARSATARKIPSAGC